MRDSNKIFKKNVRVQTVNSGFSLESDTNLRHGKSEVIAM